MTGLIIVASFTALFFITRTAKAAIAPDSRFTKIMPNPNTATQNRDAHLEIAQIGDGNTLDAKESWGKYYFDPAKVTDGTIGISKGGYGGEVDTLGTSRGGNGQRFADTNAVKYEFYLAMNRPSPVGGFIDEVPCRAKSSDKNFTPSLTVYSGEMSVTGWYKIDAARFVNNARCGDKPWGVTEKSGKYVLFVRASWNTSPPKVNNVTQGRVNAFKLGAAYTTKSGDPLTGYWSDTAWTATNERPTTAAYAVQDRLSPNNTNGDYTFKFAPDCRLAPGQQEARYLHWADVDYPEYYQAPWPVQPPPEFDLVEVSPSGSRSTVLRVRPGDNLFNGPNEQNVHNAKEYKNFKGGYTYEWVWRNVARIDGINFWIPYDDYPALNGGCGEWKHELKMKAGTTTTPAVSDAPEFRAAGGQTVRVNLSQFAVGKDAGPETKVDLTVAASGANQRSIATTFSGVTASLGGSTNSGASTPNSRVISWTGLDRLGPTAPYPSSRTNIIADFKVREDAPDGARYCASAVMSPKSSTEPGGTRSTPNQICFTIDNSLKPYLTTENGDVHAGDCTIDPKIRPVNGRITGQKGETKGSSGTFIVSAGDAITQFGSGGSPGGNGLTFGKGGFYGNLCRPTLADMQKELAKGGFTSQPGDSATPFNLASLGSTGRYVVYFNGPGTVFGKAKVPVTVFSTGTLTIQGSEFGSDVAARTTRNNLPVVGVIAKDIKIKREVIDLKAQLYATGNIDTCSDSTTVACKNTLTLSGFAMAREFSFKRSSAGSNGLQLGELFGFNGAFYLNPPPGFSSPAGAVKYLGERAPLY